MFGLFDSSKVFVELARYSENWLCAFFKHSWTYKQFFFLTYFGYRVVPILRKVPFAINIDPVIVGASCADQTVTIELILKKLFGYKFVKCASKNCGLDTGFVKPAVIKI